MCFIAATPPPVIAPALLGRARSLAAEHDQLSKQLAVQYDTQIARKVGELSPAAKALNDWISASTVCLGFFHCYLHHCLLPQSHTELQKLLQDPSTDPELHSLAAEELDTTSESLVSLSNRLRTSLIPVHSFAHLPCLLEVRPGAGGSEAALFAGDLLRMYQAFCKRHGLRAKVIKLDAATVGNASDSEIQEAVLEIDGEGAYDLLRCEAGVHRVQRVPATEKQGRTHTSAVSVIVLPNFPEAGEELGESNFDSPESDYYVNQRDVRVDVMRARGAGGQHVNTTDSAVRLTHIPTNTVVAMQDSRSQQQNRQKAWQILRARLAQARREAREEEKAALRVSVVGVARMGRGDKIRTYNWSQQRVTDHRSGITLHHLDNILEGGDSLDKVMESVRAWLRERDVESLIADEEAEAARSAQQSRNTTPT